MLLARSYFFFFFSIVEQDFPPYIPATMWSSSDHSHTWRLEQSRWGGSAQGHLCDGNEKEEEGGWGVLLELSGHRLTPHTFRPSFAAAARQADWWKSLYRRAKSQHAAASHLENSKYALEVRSSAARSRFCCKKPIQTWCFSEARCFTVRMSQNSGKVWGRWRLTSCFLLLFAIECSIRLDLL